MKISFTGDRSDFPCCPWEVFPGFPQTAPTSELEIVEKGFMVQEMNQGLIQDTRLVCFPPRSSVRVLRIEAWHILMFNCGALWGPLNEQHVLYWNTEQRPSTLPPLRVTVLIFCYHRRQRDNPMHLNMQTANMKLSVMNQNYRHIVHGLPILYSSSTHTHTHTHTPCNHAGSVDLFMVTYSMMKRKTRWENELKSYGF